MSIIILLALVFGIVAGYFVDTGIINVFNNISSIMLFLLIFSVGIEIGLNKEVFVKLKKIGFKILLIPFGIAVGSLFGGAIVSLFISESFKESLAISSGLGWYSLSGILLTEAGNPTGGAISFLANVFREILTFAVVPLIAENLNFYCAIAPGGATTMDTTLAVISRNTNGKIAVISFINGMVLTSVVPVLVPLFL